MSTITALSVKDLRSQTNCPMLDCKQALIDANGDFDIAKKLLRERLGSLDTTKPDNGSEGLIAVNLEYGIGNIRYCIVKIGTETDFSANNQTVISGCQQLVECPEIDDSIIKDLRSSTGENIVVREFENKTIQASDGSFYIHHNRKTASIVLFSGKVSDDVKKSIAMHIVATTPSPICITPEEVPDSLIQNEREFFIKKAQGKPQNIQDKIVEGGLNKFKSTLALNEQPLVMDSSKKVKDILPDGVSIVHFVHWSI